MPLPPSLGLSLGPSQHELEVEAEGAAAGRRIAFDLLGFDILAILALFPYQCWAILATMLAALARPGGCIACWAILATMLS